MSKILQYELWQECNQHCVYCTLGRNHLKTPDSMKIEAIDTAIADIQQLVQGEVSTLGFIGGEFFQGQLHSPEVRLAFLRLIDLSNSLLNRGTINELWLNATLTSEHQDDLFLVLDRITQLEKVWVLTSFDTKGRFHTDDMLQAWKYNVNKLHERYPELKINTTMITTGDFIQEYLNDTLDLASFSQTFDTKIFLKTPVKPDDLCHMTKESINEKFGYNFFPTEIEFMKFLMKYKTKEGDTAYANLFSNELKAEELHKNYNTKDLRNVTFIRNKDFSETLDCDKSIKEIESLPCGHSNVYQCFVDTDSCAICAKRLIQDL